MKCKYLKPDGTCEKLSDSEVKQPCVMGPCEHDTAASKLKSCPFCGGEAQACSTGFLGYGAYYKHNQECPMWCQPTNNYKTEKERDEAFNRRTASPRFTEVEREAIEMTLLSAEDVLSLEKICRPVKGVGKTNKLADAIATVRKMLSEGKE